MNNAAAPDLYRSERAALLDRLRELDGADAGRTVPTCAPWTIANVVAHLSGLVAETLAGVPPPRGSDEATARQVGDRESLTLAEICDEWQSNADAFDDFARSDPDYTAALLCDLVVHGQDIAETVGWQLDETSDALHFAADTYLRRLQHRAADQLDIALTGVLGGIPLAPTAGTKPLTVAATEVDFLRTVTGRRPLRDAGMLGWSGDATTLLETCFYQYGAPQA